MVSRNEIASQGPVLQNFFEPCFTLSCNKLPRFWTRTNIFSLVYSLRVRVKTYTIQLGDFFRQRRRIVDKD